LQLLMAACQQMPLLFLSVLQGMVSFGHPAFCEPWVLLNRMRSSASSPVQQSYIKLPACRDGWSLIGFLSSFLLFVDLFDIHAERHSLVFAFLSP
jgi:hypothetical protein